MIYAQIHTFNETQTTIAIRLDQPDESWIAFDVPDGAWLFINAQGDIEAHEQADIDAQALSKLKADKNAEINEARLEANHLHFEHAGKLIASDALSRGDIDGINGYVATRNALPPGFPGVWKAKDNTYVDIPDVAAWNSLYDSMILQGNTNFAKSQQLKQALAAATTPAQVEAIKW